ncbi:beta-N-acetylhexosaminidase [Carboxylicivirga mesophila]|uniref:beta-N-acetylhexosaminidase n=1 Tax=Carboxylicivirga mesophila TaxID=1166478 RepID=A0ABS5KCE2_9BACT|nr:beta-N-acetylhexosaminidase [Carboxylicivirga mesophila]MBS2212665.1 beta-N-acetylhexosaminidase [Carboxylicivirga mesophila]
MAQHEDMGLIPQPYQLKTESGHFKITGETGLVIGVHPDLAFETNYLAQQIEMKAGFKSKVVDSNLQQKNCIYLGYDDKLADPEEYTIRIDSDRIEIAGSGQRGIFYGIQTLVQLIWNTETEQGDITLPGLFIHDRPRFAYRALMLDPARHFLSVDDIKRYIDVMAMYKFNHLHLHLSDDQGWRVEIEKYPLLVQKGSFREETDGDGKPHSGYYKKDELKELVAYAQERYITIVPELDVPGHSVAALSAYPEFTCFPKALKVRTTPGVSKDLFCAGNDKTFTFLRDVISEMAEVFPSDKFHLGGDEAPLDHWKECSRCQEKIKEKGLIDEHGLMSYFFSEMNQILKEHNKRPLFWYELDVPQYPVGSTMYAWRGGLTPEVITKTRNEGFPLICSPGEHAYFDYPQARGEETCDWMAYLPLRQVYKFDPGYGLPANEQAHIIGVEATLWGEYIKDIDRAFYMTWPRGMALAEAGWSEMNNRDWQSFMKRLEPNLNRLHQQGVNFRMPDKLNKK